MILNLLIAFLGGFVSFLSPCVLPLIPGYISYISGQTLEQIIIKKESILLKAVFFSIGFSIVFICLGITASLIGKFLINYSIQLRIAAGIIIIIFSLQLIGLINFKILNFEKRFFTKKYSSHLIFPTVVGAAFGFGWTPCIGPILGSILALSSLEGNLLNSILLLSFYSLGLAIPFIISGYAVQKLLFFSKRIKNYILYISRFGGVILLTTGILILTNKLQFFGFYIFKIFPFFSKFG